MKLSIVTAGLFALILGCDGGTSDDRAAAPPPDDYAHFIVLIADGTWDPADPDYHVPTLEEIQRDTWKFSDDDIARYEIDAKEFFVSRFGIDVDDPANADRMDFGPLVIDPRAGYRVVSMSNRAVPPAGWPLIDGSYVVTITDPEGLELGGEAAGIVAPVGSLLSYGRYAIATDDGEIIPIDFRSITPIVTAAGGLTVLQCELSSPEFGSGEAYAVGRQSQTTSGEFSFEIRNVLTFE
jgi:hypothetical protein